MAYIPEEHRQYPVLPYSRKHGGEVFQYLNWPEKRFSELVGEHLLPYGYDSYEEYFAKVDKLIEQNADNPKAVYLLEKCKENIAEWNRKEEWSICKYLGKDDGNALGLRHGGYYYWPCTAKDPKYRGVIDEEEFTAYLYPTDPDLWEIVVDPTGMAHQTIYGGENAMSKQEYENVMEQLENKQPDDLQDVVTL